VIHEDSPFSNLSLFYVFSSSRLALNDDEAEVRSEYFASFFALA